MISGLSRMKVDGQLHSPAALPTVKQLPLPTE